MQNTKYKKASIKLKILPECRRIIAKQERNPAAKNLVEGSFQAAKGVKADTKPAESGGCLASRKSSPLARTSKSALAGHNTNEADHLAVEEDGSKAKVEKQQEESKQEQATKQEGRQWESLALLPGRGRSRLAEQLRLTI